MAFWWLSTLHDLINSYTLVLMFCLSLHILSLIHIQCSLTPEILLDNCPRLTNITKQFGETYGTKKYITINSTNGVNMFEGCDSNFEVSFLPIFKVATNKTSTLHHMYLDST